MLRNWLKKNRLWLAILVWLLCILVAPTIVSAHTDSVFAHTGRHVDNTVQTGTLVYDTVHGTALESNLLGDSSDRSVYVYLPASYNNTTKLYPVIYLLHAYGSDNNQWGTDGDVNIRNVMNDLIAAGKVNEMIVVMPDCNNKYRGSYYTNSVTTGNWEDFLTQDLIDYIDTKYRTKSQAASRGIAGHSMGGYGAIKLGMKHPDIYGAVYGLSACCMKWGDDFSPNNTGWEKTLAFKTFQDLETADFYPITFLALSAAWSPNPDNLPFLADFLVNKQDNTYEPIEDVQAKWSANMPVPMADQYSSNLRRLRGITFDVGTQDQFPHVIAGARVLSQLLTRNGVPHVYEEFDGGHSDKLSDRITTKLLPFFSRVLE